MPYLVDTNMLTRSVQPHASEHQLAVDSIAMLRRRGEQLFITAQNITEFWSVATRPANVNGLGLSLSQVDQATRQLEQHFPLLPDTPAIYLAWRQLVVTVGVSGRQVHDARLVAVMQAYGLTHLLTFNPSDFRRYPGIAVIHPQDVIPASP
jgi:predicted nucleic acid-binding protein